jgi:hypothetical protein
MTFFYPASRLITNVTQAQNAVVTLMAASDYKVGQDVTFYIKDPNYGMIQLDNITATIIAVDDNVPNITVNVDTTGFDAFTVPAVANQTHAMLLPSGINTGYALGSNLDILSDAMRNTLRN